MPAQASHIFVGVIQKHHFDSWPIFRFTVPCADRDSAKYWKVLRREVRVETLLRGAKLQGVIQVYEIFWTGGANGEWNATRNGERDLFFVRLESGRYHVVGDWQRSIYPVTSGPHSHLPLDDSRPFWERIALMNWWVERSDDTAHISHPDFQYNDPGGALSLWRTISLERGLVRHPSPGVRVPACRALISGGFGQDECWEALSDNDRSHIHDGGWVCCSADEVTAQRRNFRARGVPWWWTSYRTRESRRLLTTVSDPKLRAQFCDLFTREYPGDLDTGCPADQPPPATIVTERGDVPLLGPWPR
jgi:hypothetical protein